MRKRTAIAIFVGIMFVTVIGYSPKIAAEVSVNIGIGVPLPQVVIHAPTAVVVIPGTYAYFAPDVGVEIFFYHGYWYRPHRGHWYRAGGYNGPWKNIKHGGVPHVLRDLPPDFGRTVRRHERIRYADFKNNWKTWERNKHWDRHEKKHEVRDRRNNGRWDSNQRSHGGKGKHKR